MLKLHKKTWDRLFLFFVALAFLVVLAHELQAKIIPESTTNTAQDTSSVDVTKNVPFGVGPDFRDHRLAVDNAGRLIGAPTGTTISGGAMSMTLTAITGSAATSYYDKLTTPAGATIASNALLAASLTPLVTPIAGSFASVSALIDCPYYCEWNILPSATPSTTWHALTANASIQTEYFVQPAFIQVRQPDNQAMTFKLSVYSK